LTVGLQTISVPIRLIASVCYRYLNAAPVIKSEQSVDGGHKVSLFALNVGDPDQSMARGFYV
jgi:hypothetical protein